MHTWPFNAQHEKYRGGDIVRFSDDSSFALSVHPSVTFFLTHDPFVLPLHQSFR